MKRIIFFITIITILFLAPVWPAGDSPLPPLESLKELPLELVANFTDTEDIASPAIPILTTKGELFFYDVKLQQVSKTHLENPEVTAIGRLGEGPGEYIGVTGIYADSKHIYITDTKQKLLCYSTQGKYKWEIRTGDSWWKIIGVKKETFYMEGTVDLKKLDESTQGIFEFQKNKPRRLIIEEPQFLFTSQAIVNGKKQGVGVVFVGTPAMRLNLEAGQIITAASDNYQINFFDLQGKKQKTIKFQAPKPQFSKGLEKYSSAIKKQKYAIIDLFCHKDQLIVVSNYYKEGKPRVDFFTKEGKLLGSYLMPFQIDKRENIMSGRDKTVSFSQGYVIYKDPDYAGFKIYRPKTTL